MNRIGLIFLVTFVILSISCESNGNAVAYYLENSELQYEGDVQERNVQNALNDILLLTEEQLKVCKYTDYAGVEGQWDLPTLIYKHFVPGEQGLTLGDDFYRNVKAKDAQDQIKHILENIQESQPN